MQGVYILDAVGTNASAYRRPKSKKEIREILAAAPERVVFESTSLDGSDFGGPAENLPLHQAVHFVGPDPARKRNFYGTASHASGKWVVK